jgi:D-inositol-3-phosphate glycosyltransferase
LYIVNAIIKKAYPYMPEQLNIAMLSFHSCPLGTLGGKDTGGMNVYIQELAQELGRRGHLVDIYTRAHAPEHEQVVKLGHNTRFIHVETGADETIPKVAYYSYLQKFICGIEQFKNSSNIRYDLIHSHYWLSGLASKQLQTWWHVPHIAMFHTLGAVKNNIGIGTEEPELRIEGEKEVARSCERIVAATAREKTDLVNYYGVSQQKITVIPCGVNLNLFKPVDEETARAELGLDHQKVILFVGRLDPLKGLEQLLKALTLMPGKAIPLLIIVGGDEYSQSRIQALQKIAVELNVQDRISFLGPVDQKKLPLFYNAADICIIPSYYESFGMVALESLACGTPIIATDVGNMRNIISHREAGYLIEDNSPGLLASKITELFSQTEKQAQEATLRRSLAARYSWNIIADMILQEYTMVLRNHYHKIPIST